MRMNAILAGSMLLASACSITAKVTVTGQPPKADGAPIPKGHPAKIQGSLENHGDKDVLLDSHNFVWTPEDGDLKFDLNVKKGSTLVTVLKYPNGPTARMTSQVPVSPEKNEWPFQVLVDPVDLLQSQQASVDFFKDLALNMSLKEAPGATAPPTTTYEQVSKLIGAIVIVPKNWKPADGILTASQASVRVLKADPPPAAGVGIQRKMNILNDTAVSTLLNIPIYGSLGAKLSLNSVYRLNFDLTHTSILSVDEDIFRTLIDTKDATASAAMAELELWEKISPDSKIIVLRSMQYVVSGTIGVVEGKSFTSSMDVAVASAFSANAAHSFNVNDETYIPYTGVVTSWLWVQPEALTLRGLVTALKESRKSTLKALTAPPTLEITLVPVQLERP